MPYGKGGRGNKLYAASAKLGPLVCISSPTIGRYVFLVLGRHLGHSSAEVAGEGLAVAVELHEGVDVGFAFTASQGAIDSHIHHLQNFYVSQWQ